MPDTKGKVQTVLGLVEPSALGQTLMHEHMHLDFHTTYLPPEGRHKGREHCPFSLENVGWIRQNPYGHLDNITFDDAAVRRCIVPELVNFRQAGGGAVVEVTNYGINRSASALAEYSTQSGVHIISGTGFYQYHYQTASDQQLTVEEMTSRSVRDVMEGCGEAAHVKCGIIGEVGSYWPIHEFERRAIQSAAEAQSVTGAPVNFHPGRHAEAPAEVLRIFQEAGGDASRSVMSHLDRTLHSDAALAEFAKLGSYLEFDLFGIEVSNYTLMPQLDMPSDAQRVRRMAALVRDGYADRLLVSHDIHTKHRLTQFGGHGFAHILENVVPMMRVRDISDDVISQILVANPAAVLSFAK